LELQRESQKMSEQQKLPACCLVESLMIQQMPTLVTF
jgi:hypothetical protein